MRIDSAEYVRSAHRAEDLLRDGLPQIAFIGRSNVGKSSLMNALLGRSGLARTSSTPGRTRAVNYFVVNRRCYFVDLPGYGYAKAGRQERQEWADLVDFYFRSLARGDSRGAALVIQLVDAKVGATELDCEAHDYLKSFGLPTHVVATKVDRLKQGELARAQKEIGERLQMDSPTPPVLVSARTGVGIKELWRPLDELLRAPGS